MSELLVPIAVSSQLDVTGEERIHAAPYKTVVRPAYVAPEEVPTSPLYLLVGDSGSIYTSPDWGVWTQRGVELSSGLDLLAVDYGNGITLAVGDGTGPSTNTVRRSTNGGIDWEAADFPIYVSAASDIAFGDGVFVIVGSNGSLDGDNRILTTTDGLTFVSRAVPSGAGSLVKVAFGNGMFVAVSEGGWIIYSTNQGVSWTKVDVADYLSAVTYGHDMWMVVGAFGEAYTSADAQDWAPRSNGETYTFADVGWFHSAGHFAVVTSGSAKGVYQSSDDGDTWVKENSVDGLYFCYNGTVADDTAYTGGVSGFTYFGDPGWYTSVVDTPTTFYGMVLTETPDV